MANFTLETLKIPTAFKPIITNNAMSAEKSMMAYKRDSSSDFNIKIYSNFDSELLTYVNKIPNDKLKYTIVDLLNKKLIFCGQLATHQNGILGSLLFNNKDLIGIIVEMNNLEIDVIDGSMSRANDVIYTIYQQYIRAVVFANMHEILKDNDLIDALEKYFNFLIVKSLKLSYLNDKQKTMFDVITCSFFLKYYLNMNYNLAVEFAFDKYCKNEVMRNELVNIITVDIMKRYSSFNELFNAYFDLKIILENPNNVVRRVLTSLRLYGYLFVSSSLDYLISTVCCSKYNFSVILSCFVDNKIQSYIEDLIIRKYAVKLSYDSSAIKFISSE